MINIGEPADIVSVWPIKRWVRMPTWNFTKDGIICELELFHGVDSPNTLSSATLTSLDHHREANLLRTFETLLDARHASFPVDIVRNDDVTPI